MNREERPIVFTVRRNDNLLNYSISSTDSRAKHSDDKPIKFTALKSNTLFDDMVFIARELNAKGYAVLFEVD